MASFKVFVDRDRCNACEECLEACTAGVLQLRDGKVDAVADEECLGCENCVTLCDADAIRVSPLKTVLSDQCAFLLRDILD